MRSFFTYGQWRWVKERYDEGYSMEMLSDFLGVTRHCIRTAFIRLGFYPETKANLPPLIDRRKEFQSLAIETENGASHTEAESKPAEWLAPQIGSADRAPRDPN